MSALSKGSEAHDHIAAMYDAPCKNGLQPRYEIWLIYCNQRSSEREYTLYCLQFLLFSNMWFFKTIWQLWWKICNRKRVIELKIFWHTGLRTFATWYDKCIIAFNVSRLLNNTIKLNHCSLNESYDFQQSLKGLSEIYSELFGALRSTVFFFTSFY